MEVLPPYVVEDTHLLHRILLLPLVTEGWEEGGREGEVSKSYFMYLCE